MFKKWSSFLVSKYGISIQEARGLILLVSILLVLIGIQRYLVHKNTSETLAYTLENFGNETLPESEKSEFQNYNKQNFKDFNKENNARPYVLFNFNPNTASAEDFKKLGLPPFVHKIVSNYITKGGKIKYKEDFKKIYGVKPEKFDELQAYITLPSKADVPKYSIEENLAANADDKPLPVKTIAQKYIPKVNTFQAFDLNTADTSDLVKLKGIGAVLALRIINFRDKLGGFYNVDQVAKTYNLPPEVMPEIKAKTFIKKPVNKIKINFSTNLSHIYLKPNSLGNRIINYRNQHGPFKNIEDLKNVVGVTDEMLQNLEPYLDFSN